MRRDIRVRVFDFGDSVPRSPREILVRFVVHGAGLWLAAGLVPGIQVGDVPSLAAATAIFGLLNAFVRPLAYLASACLIVLTLGLFIFVIHAGLLAVTAWICGQLGLAFSIEGFWSALFGSLIVSLVSLLAHVLQRSRRGSSDA